MQQTYHPANADLVVNINGKLVETSTTRACPEGITRMTILDLCQQHGIPSRIHDIPEAAIHQADEVFCTGTMGEIAAIARIDRTTFGDGKPGPMTERLSKLYAQVTASEGTMMV